MENKPAEEDLSLNPTRTHLSGCSVFKTQKNTFCKSYNVSRTPLNCGILPASGQQK